MDGKILLNIIPYRKELEKMVSLSRKLRPINKVENHILIKKNVKNILSIYFLIV